MKKRTNKPGQRKTKRRRGKFLHDKNIILKQEEGEDISYFGLVEEEVEEDIDHIDEN